MPKWRRYPIIGITLGVYSDQLRFWLQSRVRYSANPASADPADIAAAELAEGALKFTWSMLEMDMKKIDLGAWLLATGNGSLRTFWDTDTGVMVPLAIPDKEGNLTPINPETLQPDPGMGEPIMVDAGEIGVEVLNPQLVRYNKSSKDGVMVGSLMTEDEVSDRYGEDFVDKIKFSKIDSALLTDLSFAEQPGIVIGSADLRRALVVEHYIPKSKSNPDGLWWTVSNQTLITPPNPLPGGEVPITRFGWVPVPGSKVATTPLYDITFSNKMYDEISGKIQEWAAKVLPKRILVDGGGISPEEINDEPGQELLVNAGGEPGWDKPPGVPPEFFNMLQQQMSDVRFVGGYETAQPSAPVKGQPLGAGRQPQAGLGKESEASLLEIMSKSSWEHHGRVVLGYIKKFYTKDRIETVVGKDKLYQWVDFSQVDLDRLPAAVHVDEIPLFASARQNRADTVIGLMATPAAQVIFSDIGPDGEMVLDKDRIEIAMSALGIDVGLADLDPDIAEARNEQALIRSGQETQVEQWQDHALHISEHQRVMKGMTFRAWSEEAQQMLQKNVQEHGEILSEAAQAEQQQLVETEKQMRDIRETAEQQADARGKMAEVIIDAIGDMIRTTIKETLGGDDNEGDSS